MAAFGEERPLPQSDYNTSRALNGANPGFGQFFRSRSASLARRSPPKRNPAPPRGSRTRRAVPGERTIGLGRNCPGVRGEEPSIRPAPSSPSGGMLGFGGDGAR
ncbi:unnamed protein product [Coccothraustes coccothraustes]